MAGVFAALLDKRKRAMRAARFRAWWEGEEFDEAAAAAAVEEALAAAEAPKSDSPPAPSQDVAEAPFEPPPVTPRVAALQQIWGEGRVMPGDAAAEALHPARLGLAEGGALCILGAGLAAPVAALAQAHKGKCAALEWRAETRANLEAAIRRAKLAPRVEVRAFEIDAFAGDPEAFDGLVSFDEFTYAEHAPLLASRIAATLKPGACAMIEAYAAVADPAFAPAFATAFAEPHLCAAGDLVDAIEKAGLAVEANEDQSEEHLAWARAGFKRLEGVLAAFAEHPLAPQVLQEIAWEATAWRARVKLLSQRRLERRQIVARKNR
jgi:hypothetical protein